MLLETLVREPPAREARRIAANPPRQDDAELEEAYDAEDEDNTEALELHREQVSGKLQAVEEALQGYAPNVCAVAGAIVTLDREGAAHAGKVAAGFQRRRRRRRERRGKRRT